MFFFDLFALYYYEYLYSLYVGQQRHIFSNLLYVCTCGRIDIKTDFDFDNNAQ